MPNETTDGDSYRVAVRSKGQVTLPRQVRAVLNIDEGDDVQFIVQSDGAVVVRGMHQIPADQAWFWTEEWQAGEKEASEQIAAGNMTVFQSGDEFLAHLDAAGDSATEDS
jgi:AbrB family looped-hinge helix DNA binding protein